jgi:hypothetical protein
MPSRRAFLEKLNPCFHERHVESEGPNQLLSGDTFMVGTLKGIGPGLSADRRGADRQCREFCGSDRHPYELYLALNDIEDRKTRVGSPRTNGFVERFNGAVLEEFFGPTMPARRLSLSRELSPEISRSGPRWHDVGCGRAWPRSAPPRRRRPRFKLPKARFVGSWWG